jgi:molecular chaperone DnaJ
MNEKSYYEILGINTNASSSEIKKGYKKMAMKYHPDRNQDDSNAEEKFKEVNEAYQILSDGEKRSIYDRYGKDALNSQGYSNSSDMGDMFSDFFSDMFNGRGSQTRQRTPYELDNIIQVHLSFRESIFGCRKNIQYTYKTTCKACNSTGAKNGKMSICATCNGQGQVYMKQAFMTIQQPCPACNGTGSSVKESCNSCMGNKYIMQKDNIDVDIPEGIDNGMQIRVSGKGNIYSSNRGDLYLKVKVQQDSNFIRDENNIYLQLPILFSDILLEKTIKVPTLRKNIQLNLKKEMKDKEHCVFRHEGVKDVRSNNIGNFIIEINIIYPQNINSQQKELLKQLDISFQENNINQTNETIDTIQNKLNNWKDDV